MSLTIITACSNRKRAAPDQIVEARALTAADIDSVATAWTDLTRKSIAVATADRVYCGRGFQEARAVASATTGDLIVVSAGLGLVRANQRIPAYGMTVIGGAVDSILAKLPAGTTTVDWWRAMTSRSAFHTPLDQLLSAAGPIVLALPGAYLAMLSQDVLALGPERLARLRIITGSEADGLDPQLRPFVMPYDERLEDPRSQWRGTRSDFASRAARHFAEVVLAADANGDAESHRRAVAESLAAWSRPATPSRTRKTDEEIFALLHTHWDAAKGSGSRLLRIVRDDLGVACEQGRMASLVAKVRAERSKG